MTTQLAAPRTRTSRPRWRAAVVVLAALGLAVVLAGHRLVPNVYSFGSLLDSVVPLFGLAVPVLALAALAARSRAALLAVALPAAVWAAQYGSALLPPQGGPAELRVVSQNLFADNPDPAATVTALAADGPDLIALQESTDGAVAAAAERLRETYPYHAIKSTVGLLSKHPIGQVSSLDSRTNWIRGLRAVVDTPQGDVTVYVAHLRSARINETASRDRNIQALADAVRADDAQRVLVLGDLNTSAEDRAFAPLSALLRDAQADAGWGFGLTWPSALPVLRPDQVLYRGLDATDAGVLRTPGTDHRAVTSSFAFPAS
ncbi:teicoplanin resistance protein VanJ [Catellatospora methionotrophica]|uniref:Teicoplanin resistance protein VanJ n=1 Tax=Catellatospora methionotrophica TaxID=121620 RepID=A0A8J3L9B9_9ACTN|nr:endonuclease/exonuclease/phosphatase family protein [Catellatospora methionotrophica]GIG14630.1 teicoplanin resistance protein VanJ [Catellatospora methionotrophica]